MRFRDQVQVSVYAGDGGDGGLSFRKEKFVDHGGPDGGDGGRGGNIVFVGDDSLNTLAKFRHKQKIKAEDGEKGDKRNRRGASADETEVTVPIGTVVYHDGNELADILENKQRVIVAKGGDGGFGNAHFKSSVRQAPRIAEKGEPGEEKELNLELKLIADVGLVGFPNAGKSTFLSVVSNAKPKVADYPFTTLEPHLGVNDIDGQSLLIADIPGIIEGANEGKGLGHDFLRHIERSGVLLHFIDIHTSDIIGDYKSIRSELAKYETNLSKRPTVIVLTKIDGVDEEIIKAKQQILETESSSEVYAISSSSGDGVQVLLKHVNKLVQESKKALELEALEKAKEKEKAIRDNPEIIRLKEEQMWEVIDLGDSGWQVKGKKIEKFAIQTDYSNEWGVHRLKDIMKKMGIMHALTRAGAQPGDRTTIGEKRFTL